MNFEKFLVEYGLYDRMEISVTDYNDLIDFLSGNQKIDIYCSKCGEKRTFNAVPNEIRLPERKSKSIKLNLFDSQDEQKSREIAACIRAQKEREEIHQFEVFQNENRLIVLNYMCGRDESHKLAYVLLLEENSIQKIGQYPSYADIDIPQAEIYRKELGKEYYNELKRAIGLYSCNVGIGSFVYLRRILEKIIMDGLQAAIADRVITQEEFELDENKHQRRVEDKIKLLSAYLPKVLSENKIAYGIVSKGIHELSEEECRRYFPVLEQLIKMCLDEIIAEKARKISQAELKRKIGDISSEIKSK